MVASGDASYLILRGRPWVWSAAGYRERPTLGEDVVTACAAVHPAHDLRAFGRVFARLARAGKIRPAGFARRKRGHGSPGIVWAAAEESCR